MSEVKIWLQENEWDLGFRLHSVFVHLSVV